MEAAERELGEETGYKPGKMTYLGELVYDCYANLRRHYVIAEDSVPSGQGQDLDKEEQALEVVHITISELLENAREGRMSDPGAVLLAYDKLKELEGK